MGAVILHLEIKGKDVNRMKKTFEKICKAEREEFGHQEGYCGSWGYHVGTAPVKAYGPDHVKRWTKRKKEDAQDFLEQIVEKYEPPRYIQTTNSFLICACIPE